MDNINEIADINYFINKFQTEYTPPEENKYSHYSIKCQKTPPNNTELRIIHNTIVTMKKCLLEEDENNFVNFFIYMINFFLNNF